MKIIFFGGICVNFSHVLERKQMIEKRGPGDLLFVFYAFTGQPNRAFFDFRKSAISLYEEEKTVKRSLRSVTPETASF